MDTHMTIRSGIFLVAGLTAISFPKRVFTIQTRVITYLAETIHLKFLYPMLRVEQERAITIRGLYYPPHKLAGVGFALTCLWVRLTLISRVLC